jgi:mRNA-degrading endonuclease RelE of RelBE toxin-antitoxin system
MSFKVTTVDSFEKQFKRLFKKYKSLKQEVEDLLVSLEIDPLQGDYIGDDCYKIRLGIASKGKGKRGGARVITCVKIVGETVFLLSIYDKSEKEDLEEKELDKLLKLADIKA